MTHNNRIQYPLTDQAKRWATQIVDEWKKGNFPQYFVVVEWAGREGFYYGGLDGGFTSNVQKPPLNVLLELSCFNLIHLEAETLRTDGIPWLPQSGNIAYGRRWHFTLLHELQNAVENDFVVSDYFLTFNAVGTIIHGDQTITDSGSFQSGASNFGDVSQEMTYSEIADKISEILGNNLLQTNSDLSAAIDELRSSIENDRQSKVGKVISELGRGLQHGANTFVVMQAIGFLAQILR